MHAKLLQRCGCALVVVDSWLLEYRDPYGAMLLPCTAPASMSSPADIRSILSRRATTFLPTAMLFTSVQAPYVQRHCGGWDWEQGCRTMPSPAGQCTVPSGTATDLDVVDCSLTVRVYYQRQQLHCGRRMLPILLSCVQWSSDSTLLYAPSRGLILHSGVLTMRISCLCFQKCHIRFMDE
jgi:hypothetical protein